MELRVRCSVGLLVSSESCNVWKLRSSSSEFTCSYLSNEDEYIAHEDLPNCPMPLLIEFPLPQSNVRLESNYAHPRLCEHDGALIDPPVGDVFRLAWRVASHLH